MTNKIFMPFLGLALACPSMSLADTEERATIGGTVVGKFATMLTFSGDDVVLTFDDGTTRTADMSLVSIDLAYDAAPDPSGITGVTSAGDTTARVYSICGQYMGNSTEGLAKGLYIVNGKKVIIK